MESKCKAIGLLLYSITCWLISSSGLAWEVTSLSIDFFKYETFSQLFITRPQKIRPPAVVMCSLLADFWNGSTNLTIADLLSQQSPVEAVMSHVNYRLPPNYTYEYHDYPKGKQQVNPMDIIKIGKFLKNKFTCYSFKLQEKYMTDFDYRLLVTDFPRPLIWVVFLNRKSTAARMAVGFWYIFMHPWEQSGFYQAGNNFHEIYWPDMRKRSLRKILPINRLIALTYQLYQTYLLTPPYETDCFNYSTSGSRWESQAHCFETCFNETAFKRFGLVSPSIPTSEPSNHTRFRSWLPEYRKYEERCRIKCPMKDCRYNDFIPVILSAGDSFNPEFRLHATNHPLIRQTALAKMDLTEYVTFVLSCISFWFGFSPLGFLLRVRTVGRNGKREVGRNGKREVGLDDNVLERRRAGAQSRHSRSHWRPTYGWVLQDKRL